MSGPNRSDTYLVDSNIFLRIIVRDDQKTWQDCIDAISAIEQNHMEAYIPTVVAAEIQYVLKSFYGFEKSSLVKALAAVVGTKHLETVDDLSFSVAVKFFEDYNVKFVDCLLASSRRVQDGNASILSYDRDFDKLGVRRMEPRDLLKNLPKRRKEL
ncbi:PIN domain-containing protein [Candidatus Gottesmanbacteria bacterium]|nr:PIN domain-containing protein [Candidatus Gottesmanbacteria bacterium]